MRLRVRVCMYAKVKSFVKVVALRRAGFGKDDGCGVFGGDET